MSTLCDIAKYHREKPNLIIKMTEAKKLFTCDSEHWGRDPKKIYDDKFYKTEIERRISVCINTNSEVLDLSHLHLKELPVLPNHIKTLLCSHNDLTELPENLPQLEMLFCGSNELSTLPILPDTVHFIECAYNKIIHLPSLPKGLTNFYCYENYLTTLPELPETLKALGTSSNKLTSLPKIPNSLLHFYCRDNAYLYIPLEIASRFRFQDNGIDYYSILNIPNYPLLMNGLKKIHSSQKRLVKILFCNKLQDQIDEFRYRPSGAGYLELLCMNKNKFADL